MCMASLTLIFTWSVSTLQSMRPLGQVGSKFNWPSEDQCQRSHSKWVFVFIPHLKSKYTQFILSKLSRKSAIWVRFPSPILSQVTWQVTWLRLWSQVTCVVLFWNAPYCFPCIDVSIHQRQYYCDVTHQHYSDVIECSTIATCDAYDAVEAYGIGYLIYLWYEDNSDCLL